MIKKWIEGLKVFIGAWKIWIFFAALLVGTNGAQLIANSEPTSEKPAKTASTETKSQKTVIIRKVDNSYCDEQLNDHKNGSQH